MASGGRFIPCGAGANALGGGGIRALQSRLMGRSPSPLGRLPPTCEPAVLIPKTLLCVGLATLLGLCWSIAYFVFFAPLPVALADRLSLLLATR